MDTVEQVEQTGKSISEYLAEAREHWLKDYSRTVLNRPHNFLFRNTKSKPSRRQIIHGSGSVINLFPNTQYEYDDFVCWHGSWEEAWRDDWYNVGADLYQALSKVGPEPHVESAGSAIASTIRT